MKKFLSFITVAMLITATTTTVFAGSHHGRTRTRYSACIVESCTSDRLHTHDGIKYAAHYYNDGHSYHHTDRNHH